MLDQKDRELLNILQADFPLVERPFLAVAGQLGLTETDVLERANRLKEEGIIRQISAFCDARKLNYKTTLVAMQIMPQKLDKAAAAINTHPGVSHNYSRNHYYNLWFTLALPRSSNLVKEIQTLAEQADAGDILILPALKVFKLDTAFDLTGEGLPTLQLKPETETNLCQASDQDKAIINKVQEELPLNERPFDVWADHLEIDMHSLLSQIKRLQQDKVVRRFGASLSHRAVGLTANAMTCWQVDNNIVEEKGTQLASFQWVSHCYERQSCMEWPYNLYTMVHQSTTEACREAVAKMSLDTGIIHYQILFTLKEYKKIKGKYLV